MQNDVRNEQEHPFATRILTSLCQCSVPIGVCFVPYIPMLKIKNETSDVLCQIKKSSLNGFIANLNDSIDLKRRK